MCAIIIIIIIIIIKHRPQTTQFYNIIRALFCVLWSLNHVSFETIPEVTKNIAVFWNVI